MSGPPSSPSPPNAAERKGSNKLRRFLFARHGETNFNKERRVQGTSDESILTLAGISQASALGCYVARRQAGKALDDDVDGTSTAGVVPGSTRSAPSIVRTWCSPLTRCRQTYAAISGCCSHNGTEEYKSLETSLPEPTVRHDLREIELMEWQGRLRDDVKREDAANWAAFKRDPKSLGLGPGGTFHPVLDCWERGRTNWEALRSDAAAMEGGEGAVFVVSHGAIGQCMLLQALGIGIDSYGKTRRYAFDNCECVEVEWADGEECSRRWRRVHPIGGKWTGSEVSQTMCCGLSCDR